MKILSQTLAVAFVATLLFSCGPKKTEEATGLAALVQLADKMQNGSDKVNERRAKGDTLALPYAELQKMLPASVGSYAKDGDPKGESVNMMGQSFSTASQNYKNGEQTLKVTVVDYNGVYSLLTGATAMMAMGFSVDNDEERIGPLKLGIDGVKGWEEFKKKSKRATVTMAVADRFLVTAEAENQENTDFVKDVVQSLDISKLAGM